MMAARIDSSRNDKHRKDCLDALEQWEAGLHDDCVETAKYHPPAPCICLFPALTRGRRYNLTDPTLPGYFRIKNHILIVLAERDWNIVDSLRLEAERIYAEAVSLTKPQEVAELRVLAALPVELDELKNVHGQDLGWHEDEMEEMASGEIKVKRQRASSMGWLLKPAIRRSSMMTRLLLDEAALDIQALRVSTSLR